MHDRHQHSLQLYKRGLFQPNRNRYHHLHHIIIEHPSTDTKIPRNLGVQSMVLQHSLQLYKRAIFQANSHSCHHVARLIRNYHLDDVDDKIILASSHSAGETPTMAPRCPRSKQLKRLKSSSHLKPVFYFHTIMLTWHILQKPIRTS